MPTPLDLGLEEAKHAPVVYYIGVGDRLKIGTTTTLRARMDALRAEVLHAVEPGDRRRELARHMEFGEFWIAGEWFRPEERLLEHAADLRQRYALPSYPAPYSEFARKMAAHPGWAVRLARTFDYEPRPYHFWPREWVERAEAAGGMWPLRPGELPMTDENRERFERQAAMVRAAWHEMREHV